MVCFQQIADRMSSWERERLDVCTHELVRIEVACRCTFEHPERLSVPIPSLEHQVHPIYHDDVKGIRHSVFVEQKIAWPVLKPTQSLLLLQLLRWKVGSGIP